MACATIAAVAGVKGAAAHQRHLAGRTLERYARVRGHAYAPEATTSGRRSPRVDGTKDEVAFAIDFCRIKSTLSTRVSAVVVRPPAPRLAIVQRGGIARALRFDEDGAVGFVDPRVDEAYRVRGASPADARSLLADHEALLASLDRRSGVWVACDGVRASITWAGVETDPVVLDAARDLAIAAARWHRPEAPYR